jgi:leader peptidase (prepilin peptidase) / N-methyltransferase
MIYIFVVFFSLLLGSFFGVLIDRSIAGEQFFAGRSICNSCKRKLKPFDLIPLFSFLINRGQCRYCHAKLSIWFVIYELGTSILNLLVYHFAFLELGLGIVEFLLVAIFINILWIIFLSDARYMLVPDFLFYGLAFVYLSYVVLNFLGSEFILANYFLEDYLSRFYAFLLMAIFFGGIFLISKGNAMGFADVALACILAFVIGFRLAFAMWLFSFYFGAFFACALLFLRKKNFKGHVPFGPFIIIGFASALAFGNHLLYIYGF